MYRKIKLSKMKSTVHYLKPLLWISAALGSPLLCTDENSGKLRRSRISIAWTTVVVSMCLVFIVYDIRYEFDQSDKLEDIILSVVPIFAFAAQITGFITFATAKVRNWITLIQQIKSVDEILFHETQETNKRVRKYIIWLAPCVCFLFICESVTNLIVFNVSILNFFLFFVSNIGNFILSLQYFSIALLIRDRYRLINKNIENYSLIKKKVAYAPTAKEGTWITNNLTEDDFTRNEGLRKLRCGHLTLSEASENISSIYGVPILLVLAHNWLDLMVNTYYSLVPDSRYGGRNAETIAALLLSLARNVVTLLLVCWGGDSAAGAAQSTSLALGRLHTQAPAAQPLAHTRQLELFALQLATTRAHFSCCGFFDVNLQLLFTFFATLVAYLVILLQTKDN